MHSNADATALQRGNAEDGNGNTNTKTKMTNYKKGEEEGKEMAGMAEEDVAEVYNERNKVTRIQKN